ncbi:MAG: hypothetical protein H0T46_26485 [Deltaproteobacteria bacterium]|nr:hypothetical protein [Deltaproteobacteria bacterium]
MQATERWTEDRLAALSSALALPCPVRESFLFDPDHAFRTSCTASEISLQRAIKRVFQHAGLPCDAAVVLWKSGVGPARVERDGDCWFFEIDPTWRTNAEVLGVILAREAGRALLAQRNVPCRHDADVELAAILSGLGALLVHECAVMALAPRHVRYAFVRTAKSLGVGMRRARYVLVVKLRVTLMWLRVWPRALPFGPLPSHVIIRCFCARRLRVPTGAIGMTTCPACKRKRPFDGRACRTETRSLPTVSAVV